MSYRKHQAIATDLGTGGLDKHILGVGDSATDPAPLKLEKASKNQSPEPALQHVNKNVYIGKG